MRLKARHLFIGTYMVYLRYKKQGLSDDNTII